MLSLNKILLIQMSVVIFCFSFSSAMDLYVIEKEPVNLEELLILNEIDVYAVMETGVLIGASSEGLNYLLNQEYVIESLGRYHEDAEYYLFQIEDRHISLLNPDIKIIYYKDNETIAMTENMPDAESIHLMKGLTHISFVPMQARKDKMQMPPAELITDEDIQQIIDQVSQTEYTAYVQRLQDFVTRYSFTDSCRAAELWAIDTFAAMGLDTVLFPYGYFDQTWYNAIGRKTGEAYPDSIYIIIGHIDATSGFPDSLAPGAEDNGSGSACVLEAARVLSQFDFNCTIEFVLVSGEEQGLYGSEAYAEYCFNTSRNIAGVLNFDMIAYAGGYGWDINVYSDQTFPDETALADLFASLTDQYSDAYSIRVNTAGPQSGSDHYYFSYYGFPAPFAIDAQLWSAPDWYPWYHSTNDLITNLDLDYAVQVVKGAIATLASVAGIWSPPVLEFAYPDGLPDLVNPSAETSFRVEISAGTANPQPGSGVLHYDAGGGFVNVSMDIDSANIYNATFPPLDCGAEITFYISAETDDSITVTDPLDAPEITYYTLSAYGLVGIFADDFNSDNGWSVENSCSDGQWQRGIPVGGGERGDPPTDYDGSGYCYVTDNEYGNSDVDDGYTRLISPVFDLEDDDAIISYGLWYTNNAGDAPNSDIFIISISNDGGNNWVDVDTVGPHTSSGWNNVNFRVGEFVAPSSQVKVRFEASDLGAGSVVEAGIDAVSVQIIDCQALPSGSISGMVTNSDEPIMDVFVEAEGTGFFDSTDAGGNYNLTGLPPGIYNINFQHPSYQETTISDVAVSSDSITILNVSMNLLFSSYEYLAGDANMRNGQWPPQVIGSDVTYLVNYFRGLTEACMMDSFYCSGDANGDCQVIGSDVTRLISYFRTLANVSYCPDYPPLWASPINIPDDPPIGWPDCE